MENIKQGIALYKLSSTVSSTIKSANDSICDWETLKRAPLILKQKCQQGNSSTVDDEFNGLNYQLQLTKTSLTKVIKNCKLFGSVSSLLLLSIENITAELKILILDKIYNHDSELIHTKDQLNTSTSIYQKTGFSIKDNISEPLQLFNVGIEQKINDISSMIRQIELKISQRLLALVKYDNSFNDHESLYLKQQAGEILSTKKSQKLMYLERNMHEYKSNYEELNQLLKKEMTVFFKLMAEFMAEIKAQIYFVHLMVVYQFQSHFESFATAVELEIPNTPVDLTHLKSNLDFQELINTLSIINIRDNDLADLMQMDSAHSQCRAIYDFEAQKKDDLSIKKKDIIIILEKKGLWWKGELNDRIGYFPSNYVEEI